MQVSSVQEEWNKSLQQFLVALQQTNGSSSDEKDETTSHHLATSALPREGLKVPDIFKRLERILNQSQYQFQEPSSPTAEGELDNHFAVLSYAVAEHLQGLAPERRSILHQFCQSELQNYFTTEMRVPAGTKAQFSVSADDALLLVTRAALQASFGDLAEAGYHLFSKSPVLYFSPSLLPVAHKIQQSLCLPRKAIKLLPIDSAGKVSVADLEKAVEEDQVQGRLPLLVVWDTDEARASTVEAELVAALQSFCSSQNVWLHVQGSALATLFHNPSKPVVTITTAANSFSVSPGLWGGLTGHIAQQVCVLFRDPEFMPTSMPTSSTVGFLPLWMNLQRKGKLWLRERIALASKWGAEMKKRLLQNEAIVCHSSDGDLALYFRFIPSSKGLPTTSEKDADNLIQTLNKQLLIDLSGPGGKREALAPALGLDLQLLEENCYLHFEPLRLPNLADICQEDITALVENLALETKLIDSTMVCQKVLTGMIEAERDLANVSVDSFVGLGSLRYFPAFLKGSELSADMEAEMDKLNSMLASRLAEVDPIFSEGRSIEGATCVCLGIDTSSATEETAAQYLQMVLKTADTLGLYSLVKEKTEEVILRKMEEAKQQLKRDKRQKEAEEGLIRKIPIIGGVWGWLNQPTFAAEPSAATTSNGHHHDSSPSAHPVNTVGDHTSEAAASVQPEAPKEEEEHAGEVTKEKEAALPPPAQEDHDDEQQPPPESDHRDADEVKDD